jgi:hypothetical protein
LLKAETENDLNILEKGMDNLKQATQSLNNFHCQVPVIVTLITSTVKTTLEENGTNSPILPDPTGLGNDPDTKGQLISKGNFSVFNSSKKRTLKF